MNTVGVYWAHEKLHDDADFMMNERMKLNVSLVGTLISKIVVLEA